MKISFSLKHFTSLSLFVALFFVTGATHSLWAANSIAPTLISQAGNTRAVAFESVTMNSEPFPVTSTVQFSPDNRTRICIFAMNLQLLAGEGVNAFTADAQDASGKLYPFRVEFMGQVPNFPGVTMFIVRLSDDIGDVGDVLLRLNLHGVGSNRVRVAIGHTGGGPTDDSGAIATPAPDTPPPADQPLVPDDFSGPISDADAVRFLEQSTWGTVPSEVTHLKAVGFKNYLNEQFSAPTNAGISPHLPHFRWMIKTVMSNNESKRPEANRMFESR
jgi:hypothetical protein